MDYLDYKGYKGTVEYSKADNCLCGRVVGMSNAALILYEGNNLDELRSDFQAGVDSYLEGCRADNVAPQKQYSGILSVRISPETHSEVALLAKKAGISITTFVKQALDSKIAAML